MSLDIRSEISPQFLTSPITKTTTTTSKYYDIFLSYHWNYHNEVINLHRVLSKQGFRVWLDLVEIKFGDVIEVKIEEAVRNSYAFVVCCFNNDYIKSKNCELELRLAIEEKSKIFVLFLDSNKLNTLNESVFNRQCYFEDTKINDFAEDVFIYNDLQTNINNNNTSNNNSRSFHEFYKNKINIETTANKITQFLNNNKKENVVDSSNKEKKKSTRTTSYNFLPSVQAYRA